MRRVAEEIAGRQDRPGRDLLGNVLRRDIAHLQVTALQRHELRALLEQVAAVIALEGEVVPDGVVEHLHHLGADVLLREDGGEAQLWLVLRERRNGTREGKGCGSCQRLAACEIERHWQYLPVAVPVFRRAPLRAR